LDHVIIVHDHDHVPFFSHADATFVDNYFQQPHPNMKRAFPNDQHSSSKRQRGYAQDAQTDHRPRNTHSQPRQHKTPSQLNHQTTPLPDSTKHLEALLKALVNRRDNTRQLLGHDAYESAVKLSKSFSSVNTATTSLDLFQPSTIKGAEVSSSIPTASFSSECQHFSLPALPQVPDGPYLQAPFVHKSSSQHDRTSAVGDMTYERLEFLGDAYLEVIATRLIFSRYPHLAAGRQAQIRERLVKNDTLTKFSMAYNFQARLKAGEGERELARASGKILADVFEAYVAAVILSDPVDGFKRAEIWLTELWAPILLREFGPINSDGGATFNEYNQNAKQELQQKIVGKDVKLEYIENRPMEQTKHMQRYFISLFLTGWGHEKQLLGTGEGQNKVEAGNRAAMDAMVKSKDIIDEAARKLGALREQRRLEAVAKEPGVDTMQG
jgi:ribonuclease-3